MACCVTLRASVLDTAAVLGPRSEEAPAPAPAAKRPPPDDAEATQEERDPKRRRVEPESAGLEAKVKTEPAEVKTEPAEVKTEPAEVKTEPLEPSSRAATAVAVKQEDGAGSSDDEENEDYAPIPEIIEDRSHSCPYLDTINRSLLLAFGTADVGPAVSSPGRPPHYPTLCSDWYSISISRNCALFQWSRIMYTHVSCAENTFKVGADTFVNSTLDVFPSDREAS